jgi:transposase-like protein
LIAAKLGIGIAETLRKWVRPAQIDAGSPVGVNSDEAAEVRRLKREVAELWRTKSPLGSRRWRVMAHNDGLAPAVDRDCGQLPQQCGVSSGTTTRRCVIRV